LSGGGSNLATIVRVIPIPRFKRRSQIGYQAGNSNVSYDCSKSIQDQFPSPHIGTNHLGRAEASVNHLEFDDHLNILALPSLGELGSHGAGRTRIEEHLVSTECSQHGVAAYVRTLGKK